MTSPETNGTRSDDGAGMPPRAAGIGRNGGGLLAGHRDAESLRRELSQLKTELDGLMARADSMGEQELLEAHDRILMQFSSMRHAARGMASEAGRQLRTGVDATTDYVKDKPMQSVTVAAAVGLALGMLMSRG